MEKTILNLSELSVYSGISKSYLYKLTHLGKIPFSKPFGKLIFFEKKEIDNWLLSNKHSMDSDLEIQANTYATLKNSNSKKTTKKFA
jgi:excisionase family DNA binding protein